MHDFRSKLDDIYDEIHNHLISYEFSKVDNILRSVNVEKTPTVLLIGYLTITLAWKIQLDFRDEFYRKVFHKLVFVDKENPERIYDLLFSLN